MKRNIEKTVNAYREKYYKSGTAKGSFYISDVMQVKALAKRESEPQGSALEILYNAITIGIEAGYMTGYRAGLRQNRK